MAWTKTYEVASGKRYRVYWKDPSGRQHGRVFRRKSEALAWERKVANDLQTGGYTDPARGKVTLTELWTEYIDAPPRPLAESTAALYEQQWRLHIEPRLGSRRLNSIEPGDVRRLIADMERSGVGVAMTDSTFRLVRALLGFAASDRRIAFNPASGITPKRGPHREIRILTPSEVERIADEVPSRYAALVLTLGYTGLRIGEASALRVRNFDQVHGRLNVVEAASEIHGEWKVHPPKTRQNRSVTMPPFLVAVLADHVKSFPPAGPDGLVFRNDQGEAVRRHSFRRTFQRACRKAGIVPVPRVHDLRHTAASLAIQAGAHARLVQDLLGHSQISTTMATYGHVYESLHADVALKLDALRRGSLTGTPEQDGGEIVTMQIEPDR